MQENGVSMELEAPEARRAGRGVAVFALVLLFIGLKAVGNLSLAWGMKHQAEALSANPLGYVLAMANPFAALGVAMLILALLTRMALLSRADLSYVLPVTAIGYVLATAMGRFVLHETVSGARWAGTVFIVIGAAMVSSTEQTTTGGGEAR